MDYRRMPIEIESPEQRGYGDIRNNLTESSVSDLRLGELGLDLKGLVLAYGDHRGKPALRELIAADGAGLSAQDVLLTPGAAAALFIVHTALLNAGDRLVVEFPNYATNLETPRAIGCQVDLLKLALENGFRFCARELEGLAMPRTRLISLTHPHNPTGSVLSMADLEAAVALAERTRCYLLVDETYREMNYDGPTPLAATLNPRCISVVSMSKSFGLPGIRMGWIITRDPALQELFLAAKEQMVICNSVVDEEIAWAVLARRDHFLAPVLERNRRVRAMVKEWMAGQPALEWVEPRGGVVCFPRIRPASGVDVDAFYHILNAKYGTYVGPGHWFGMERRFMRIGYGWPRPAELAAGLEGIGRALAEAQDRR